MDNTKQGKARVPVILKNNCVINKLSTALFPQKKKKTDN